MLNKVLKTVFNPPDVSGGKPRLFSGKKFIITCMVIIFMSSVLTGNQLELQIAPLNPEYVKYLEALHKGEVKRFTSDGYALGHIPPPFKFNTAIPVNFDKSRNLPPSYDLRDEETLTSVKHQGTCGACWTFGTFGAVESRWLDLDLGAYDLSENNLNYGHGFEWLPCGGGNCYLSTAYLSRLDGPISEVDDPYQGESGSYHPGLTPQAYVTDARFLPNDPDVLKQIIYDYGAIHTDIHWDDESYNGVNYTYYYSGSEYANHDVLLVGWDDNKVTAGGPGAWIIRNSWGEDFGESGFFYVSYNDTKVNSMPAFYPDRIDYNSNAIIHYYDKLGAISSYGWSDYTDYGLVKYEVSEDQQITKVGTWVSSSNAIVSFDIYNDFDGSSLSNLLGTIGNQTCDYAGYYTFNLSTPIELVSCDDIYIKVKYNTPGYNLPIPYECFSENYADPTIETGKCWISSTGTDGTWIALGDDAENKYDLCIKAYGVGEGGEETGILAGKVTDALNGNPIEGATVSVAGLSDVTDSQGDYTIENVPPGTLTAEFFGNPTSGDAPLTVQFTDQSTEGTQTVTATASGYIDYTNNQVLIIAGQTVNLDISLSPEISEGEMRFVLNWGESPSDLDSHLKTPEIEGNFYHVYYPENAQGSSDSPPYATLDHDDTNSYGPETITIHQSFAGTYYYYIYNYSGSPDITESNGVIQIYTDQGLIQTLQVPTTGEGLYWNVCTINGTNQALTIINQIQESEPGPPLKEGIIPKKRISITSKGSREITSRSWNFGDGETSTEQNPSHTYQNAGTYTVSLTISDGTNSDAETKTDYITVTGEETGTLAGKVTDAITGDPIEGATVSVAGLSDVTDSQGNYTIENVPVGDLYSEFIAYPTLGITPFTVQFTDQSTEGTQTVTATATGYINYVNNQVVIIAGQTVNLDISLSPEISEGKMRFVLNWGESPSDLDSHLKTPEIEGNFYHVYYPENAQGSSDSPPYATLDHDDTDSYGPETVTIHDFFTGTYYYYIHNYSESPDITTSNGVVQIYTDQGLIQTLQVPTTGEGLYWNVCTINGTNQALTIINQIQESAPVPPLKEGIFPEKKISLNSKESREITSWSWNFGDGETSTEQNPSHTYQNAGTYTVLLTISDGVNSDIETKTDYITVYPNTDLIWPGDTDYSGTVDESDIDPIGVYWKEEGNPRSSPSFSWEGNDYPDNWSNPFASLADCNGDGEVNIADVLAICLNWNYSHSTLLSIPIIPENLESFRENFIEIYNTLGNEEIEVRIKNHIAKLFDLPIIELVTDNYLGQNYPNPFTSTTKIRFHIKKEATNTLIKVYNIKGQLIRNLNVENSKSSLNEIIWDGKDEKGKSMSNGIYFYQIVTNNWKSEIKKMILMK